VTTVDPERELVLRRGLEHWLPPRIGATGPIMVGPLQHPAAGQSSDTLLFGATWRVGTAMRRERFVLRMEPTDRRLFLDADVIREARVLRGLETTGVPAPRVRWTEDDPKVLGAPFFVMSHVPGQVPQGKPSVHASGWLPSLSTADRTKAWNAALESLVAVHDVAWRSTHPFLVEGDAGSGLARRLEWTSRWYAWVVAGRSFPITDTALAYLLSEAAAVDEGAPVLVWGDARPGNMIFDARCRVAAVIDWELATIGPAGIDLGHWMAHDEFSTDIAGIERLDGIPDREATLVRYERISGRRVPDLGYFVILQALLFAVTLVRAADIRVARGLAPPTTRMGHDNPFTQMLARRLGLPVPGLADDYVAHRSSPAVTGRSRMPR